MNTACLSQNKATSSYLRTLTYRYAILQGDVIKNKSAVGINSLRSWRHCCGLWHLIYRHVFLFWFLAIVTRYSVTSSNPRKISRRLENLTRSAFLSYLHPTCLKVRVYINFSNCLLDIYFLKTCDSI
jgi:hypothetical protein